MGAKNGGPSADGTVPGAGPVDSFVAEKVSASDLLGLQVATDQACLRALATSHLLALSHRTSLNIINNIGR